MFSFPVTIAVRHDEWIETLEASVDIDKIAVVKSLLDKGVDYVVESADFDPVPRTEIIFEDGRSLPVLEHPANITRYLDAYRSLDEFFTKAGAAAVGDSGSGDNVVPLFKAPPSCDTSEASTPD